MDFGTARRAGYDATEPILGKTGTCTDFQTASHMGWFGSFNEVGAHRLVVVVMLTGGRNVSGPIACRRRRQYLSKPLGGALLRGRKRARERRSRTCPKLSPRCPAAASGTNQLLHRPMTDGSVRSRDRQGAVLRQ